MTSPITAKACEAWWILEAADLRGLPAPFVAKAYADRVELQVRPEDFERWAEALDGVPLTSHILGGVERKIVGELLDHAVTVSAWEPAGVPA